MIKLGDMKFRMFSIRVLLIRLFTGRVFTWNLFTSTLGATHQTTHQTIHQATHQTTHQYALGATHQATLGATHQTIYQTTLKATLLATLLATTLLTGCNNNAPTAPAPPTGSDGHVFAVETGDSQLPYLVIDTRGEAIQYEPKIAADLKIYVQKELVQTQPIGIEYRGKTSFRLSDKKGFNIETWDNQGEDTDVSLLGLPEEEDWRLVGHVVNLTEKYTYDESLIHNTVAYEIARRTGRYASRVVMTEVELNGRYLGVYQFMEKPKRDKHRIDITKLDETDANITGGYIFMIDKVSLGDDAIGLPLEYFYSNWDDDARYTIENSFRSRYDIFADTLAFEPFRPPYHPEQYLETYFVYEEPDASDITPNQKTYLANYIDQFESALRSDDFEAGERTYRDFIDTASFVDYLLINELCRNVDAFRISTYLVKDRDQALQMGPVWDFNIGFARGGRIPADGWVIGYNSYVQQDPWMMPFWWERLMEDPVFRGDVRARWLSLRGSEWGDAALVELVDGIFGELQRSGAVARNDEAWDDGIGMDAVTATDELKTFLLARAAWLDSEVSGF